MARKSEHRKFNIAVVGLSGTEKQKGIAGVGKSCLCNRFMRPAADQYHTDHISVLSQTDFSGRVVNNDHFLYWGEVTKTSDEGVDLTFNVVEQTEFVDDSSFQPFKSGKTEPYYKRCASIKLQSAEKLVYFCKNQLGLELEFEQRMLSGGRLTIDGFICVFDVSKIAQRSIELQVEFLSHVLTNIARTKRPCVLATTKNDHAYEHYVREAVQLANRKEFRGNVTLVETSAHENVNVELAYLCLAHMIDRSRTKIKHILSYSDAARARRELKDVANEAYQNLIKIQVTDYKAVWRDIHKSIEHNSDYIHYVDICGSDHARICFQRLTAQLKHEHTQRRLEIYKTQFCSLLPIILPDLHIIADRSWPSIMRWLKEQLFFDQYFYVINQPHGGTWRDVDVSPNENRVPFDALDEKEIELCYLSYVQGLRDLEKREQWCQQFRDLLKDNLNVGAGISLSDVSIFFVGRECFNVLQDEEKQRVYDQYQRELKEKAKHDFQELLFEHAEFFSRYEGGAGSTPKDISEINSRLQNEARYRALNRLEDERKAMILNHLGFLRKSTRQYCPFRAQCMEVHMEKLLSTKAHRPKSWGNDTGFVLDTDNKRVNLVILGCNNLADALVREIRRLCLDDEFDLDGDKLNLDYRPIDGDVSLPQNSFKTDTFKPHGCFCVFSSQHTLDFVRQNLHKTLLSKVGELHNLSRTSDPRSQDPMKREPFLGLPVVLVLAHEAALSEEQLRILREEADKLAEKYQCPFVDIPSSMMTDNKVRFHVDQIGLAMHKMMDCLKHRSAFVEDAWQIAESIEPDIRIMMCFMCGDSYKVEIPLSPLLNHQCCYSNPDDRYPTLTLESYLGNLEDASKRKVEITTVPYHTGVSLRHSLYHGYVLVYSPKRKASLANLRAFTTKLPRVPITLLAVTESLTKAFFYNDFSQALINEGDKLAEQLHASFLSTNSGFTEQIASYTPLFNKAWECKLETEKAFKFSNDDGYSDMNSPHDVLQSYGTRLPKDLPKVPSYRNEPFGSTFGIRHVEKNMINNSTMPPHYDGPIYDVPNPIHRSTLSDDDTDEKRSHPNINLEVSPIGGSLNSSQEAVYSEISPHDTELLINNSSYSSSDDINVPPPPPPPQGSVGGTGLITGGTSLMAVSQSHVKSRRNMYAGGYDDGVPLIPHGDRNAKAKPQVKNKPLDPNKYAGVRHVLAKNLDKATQNAKKNFKPLSKQEPSYKAPLATPEHIEIGDTYMTVREQDALTPTENAYASVQDALPSGRIQRVRTTHTRKNTAGANVKGTSPSEGSEGTGDELQGELGTRRQKKRRSIKGQSSRSPGGVAHPGGIVCLDDQGTPYVSAPFVDSELTASLISKQSVDDDIDPITPRDMSSPAKNSRMDALMPWKSNQLDPDKQRRKEEKRQKEDERRKIKEEEKKQKEQDKQKRKARKKEMRLGTPSTSSMGTLEDMSQSEENLVPYFVQKCIEYIENEGISSDGLYRVPGNKAHGDLLWEKFKENPHVDISSLDIPLNAVATALKGFFSELDKPLIHNYEDLLQTTEINDKQQRLTAIRHVLLHLKSSNFEVLLYLIEHLNKVSQYSSENNMDSKNLAICFWPTLIRPPLTTFERMTTISALLEGVVQDIIDHPGYIFHGEKET